MRRLIVLLGLFAVGCGSSSPTGPTSTPPVVVVPAPTVAPLALAGQSNALFIGPYLTTAAAPELVVGFAQDGSAIAQWAAGSDLWARLAPQLHQSLRAFVWWQGESDRLTPERYESDVRAFMARVRAEAADQSLLVLICRVVDDPAFTGIRAAQAAYVATDSHAILVSSDGLPKEFGEGVGSAHLSPEGYRQMATRILAALR